MLNQHQTIKDCIAKFNKSNPLADYLIPYIGNKKEVKIIDVGSGPYSTIGNKLPGVEIDLHLVDAKNFFSFLSKYGALPYYIVEPANMENLPHTDNFFDIVHCANALDHTANAAKAVREMIRVCKMDGWVHIECNLDQMDTGHKHFWNAKEDGRLVNNDQEFDLKDFGFTIKYIDNGGERRYNKIIATLQKI